MTTYVQFARVVYWFKSWRAKNMIESTEHWDGTATMPVVITDGGRAAAGFKGSAGDCVTRAVAIASGLPYGEVYAALSKGTGAQRSGMRGKKSASARNGISTSRKWFKDQMRAWGFRWVPCMSIGSGCKVHLLKGELPGGRLIARVTRHCTAVIDGVVHDTFDPHRATFFTTDGVTRMAHRCVYGYWIYEGAK